MITEKADREREKAFIKHLPRVKRIVERIVIYLPPNVDKDDLMQAGAVGLIEAIDRFDPDRGNKFMTYASYRIKGAVLTELRSRDFLSRRVREQGKRIEKIYNKLNGIWGDIATDEDVANEMGISLEKFYKIRAMAHIYFVKFDKIELFSQISKLPTLFKTSFSGAFGKSRIKCGSRDVLSLIDFIENEGTNISFGIIQKEIFSALSTAIDQLPENEKLVISLYYQDGLTMKEVGKAMEVTESRVSQIHSKAILRLRKKLRMKNLID